ncbi:phage minor tail protein L [Wohlfahrtiimonas chitiniclastica]|uniref:phage minor tail protein L n=1 Tax=Wohlfahrtiimonas chitiniclastica TaxID=400946 RepID=UPI000B98E1DE|nr:phage minor tail protein L [Wohlfahrtiimonas chitiniclastica]OYQ71615.1 phage minor tail protein L [Wohlfahrtiimonas chitiniclastica]
MISNAVKAKLDEVEQGAWVDLYDLDITRINDHGGSNHFYFCNELNEKNELVIWRGQKYMAIPIQIEGVEVKSDGPSNRPTLTIGNGAGYIAGILNQYRGLVGAKVTRYRVPAQFLDAINFINGNDHANPDECQDQSYIINAVQHNNKYASFTLAIPSETDGAIIPHRTIYATVCPFRYRGEMCGYDGWAIADENDYAVQPHEIEKDKCSKRLSGCMARFGVNGQLPFGGFPMADKVNGG